MAQPGVQGAVGVVGEAQLSIMLIEDACLDAALWELDEAPLAQGLGTGLSKGLPGGVAHHASPAPHLDEGGALGDLSSGLAGDEDAVHVLIIGARAVRKGTWRSP